MASDCVLSCASSVLKILVPQNHSECNANHFGAHLKHIGAQTILVTNLVTNSVTNLSPNLVITKQSDKFVTKFVTDIGVHQIW